jgi:glucose dehydrogenase
MRRQVWILAVLISGALIAAQEHPSPQIEWLHYGGDSGGMKYSALTDIDAGNVDRLRVAWQWKHWETPLEEYRRPVREHAPQDRRRAVRHDPVQQHRRARRGDRP